MDLFDGLCGVCLSRIAKLPAHDHVERLFHPGSRTNTQSFGKCFAIECGLQSISIQEIELLDVLKESGIGIEVCYDCQSTLESDDIWNHLHLATDGSSATLTSNEYTAKDLQTGPH